MSKQILEVQNISKIFEANDSSLTVLDNFSLSLNKGESLGLIGASGSGKSTLLHIICGLEQPNSGKVFVKGENITELDSDERSVFRNKEIGFVYQFHHLLSELSTLENLTLKATLIALQRILICFMYHTSKNHQKSAAWQKWAAWQISEKNKI